MIKAEWSFRCLGIDFESINAYYGTCMGFAYLGWGDDDSRWSRLEPEEHKLYNEVYNASMSVRTPHLPFDEVYGPALVYTAIFRPDLVAAHADQHNWQWQHFCQFFEYLKRPRPVYSKKRQKLTT
jgi:hypothetical protein